MTPAPGQPTPVWVYYQIDGYLTDTITDAKVLQSVTATFTKFANTVKDPAGLEAAAPGAAAAVATASKGTAKIVNASAKIKLEPVPLYDDSGAGSVAVAAKPAAAAAVPLPKPAAAAAAGSKPGQIIRPSVTLTVITSGSSGCSAAVSDAIISSVEYQIPVNLRTSVDFKETPCAEVWYSYVGAVICSLHDCYKDFGSLHYNQMAVIHDMTSHLDSSLGCHLLNFMYTSSF